MANESTTAPASGFFKNLHWEQLGVFGRVLKSGEVTFAVALLVILVMLILPIPKLLLDSLFS